MLQKVLIPLNLSESLKKVLNMCRFLTGLGTERVLLLHVGSDKGKAGTRSQKRLFTYAQAIEELGLETEMEVRPGSVQVETINTAHRKEVDYISIPFKSRSWFSLFILGSNSKNMIRQSDLPIFIYKNPHRRESEDSFFRVLFAASLKTAHEDLIPYVRPNGFRADHVTFLYVGKRAPDPAAEQKRKDTIEEKLMLIREQSSLSEETSTCLSLLGTPRRQIIKTARSLPANLIILGKADDAGGREPVLGSTAEEVSYNAPCSVLVVSQKKGLLL